MVSCFGAKNVVCQKRGRFFKNLSVEKWFGYRLKKRHQKLKNEKSVHPCHKNASPKKMRQDKKQRKKIKNAKNTVKSDAKNLVAAQTWKKLCCKKGKREKVSAPGMTVAPKTQKLAPWHDDIVVSPLMTPMGSIKTAFAPKSDWKTSAFRLDP